MVDASWEGGEIVQGWLGEDARGEVFDFLQAWDVGEEDHGVFESGHVLRVWMEVRRGDAEGDVVYSEMRGVAWEADTWC